MNDQQTKDASMAGSQSAVMKTYGRAELAFVSGEGCWLVTDDGRR